MTEQAVAKTTPGIFMAVLEDSRAVLFTGTDTFGDAWTLNRLAGDADQIARAYGSKIRTLTTIPWLQSLFLVSLGDHASIVDDWISQGHVTEYRRF